MRVVFLDFDGVINNCDTWGMKLVETPETGILIPVDARCMRVLNVIVDKTDARVVLSTSWRKFADHTQLAPALARHGFNHADRVIGETPDLHGQEEPRQKWRNRDDGPVDGAYEKIQRGMEIWYWLEHHPEVTEIVILDDCDDMWILGPLLVQTHPNDGLTFADFERVHDLFMTGRSRAILAELRAGKVGRLP